MKTRIFKNHLSSFGLGTFVSLILFSGTLPADVFFIDCIEADSVHAVESQLKTFAMLSDSQDVSKKIIHQLDRDFLLPQRIGMDESAPFRIITAADTTQTLSPSNPAAIAILPTTASRELLIRSFAKRYPRQQTLAECDGVLFSGNTDTNYHATAAVAFMDNKILASPSSTALLWAWKNRAQLVNAQQQPGNATFRLLANAPRFSQLLPVLYPSVGKYQEINQCLADFSSVLFSITFNGESASILLRGTPRPGTRMRENSEQWEEPDKKQWAILPGNTFLGTVSKSKKPTYLPSFFSPMYAALCAPIPIPPQTQKGERVSMLLPTRDKKGFLLFFFDKLKKGHGITSPPPPKLNIPTLSVKDLPKRSMGSQSIGRCKIMFSHKQKKREITESILSLFLEKTICEYTIVDDMLITVYGPDEPLIEQVMPYMRPHQDSLPLDRKIRIALREEMEGFQIITAARLQLAKGIRHLAEILPQVKAEQLRRLPEEGDGIVLIVGKNPKTGELSASLGIQINEITALRTMEKEISPIAQEFLLHLLTQRLQQNL